MMRVYFFIGALAVFGTILSGAYMKGRWDGASAEAYRNVELVKQLNEELRLAEVEAQRREESRLREVADLRASISSLRKQANEDPDANRRAIGIDSVRRIGSIGGEPED